MVGERVVWWEPRGGDGETVGEESDPDTGEASRAGTSWSRMRYDDGGDAERLEAKAVPCLAGELEVVDGEVVTAAAPKDGEVDMPDGGGGWVEGTGASPTPHGEELPMSPLYRLRSRETRGRTREVTRPNAPRC